MSSGKSRRWSTLLLASLAGVTVVCVSYALFFRRRPEPLEFSATKPSRKKQTKKQKEKPVLQDQDDNKHSTKQKEQNQGEPPSKPPSKQKTKPRKQEQKEQKGQEEPEPPMFCDDDVVCRAVQRYVQIQAVFGPSHMNAQAALQHLIYCLLNHDKLLVAYRQEPFVLRIFSEPKHANSVSLSSSTSTSSKTSTSSSSSSASIPGAAATSTHTTTTTTPTPSTTSPTTSTSSSGPSKFVTGMDVGAMSKFEGEFWVNDFAIPQLRERLGTAYLAELLRRYLAFASERHPEDPQQAQVIEELKKSHFFGVPSFESKEGPVRILTLRSSRNPKDALLPVFADPYCAMVYANKLQTEFENLQSSPKVQMFEGRYFNRILPRAVAGIIYQPPLDAVMEGERLPLECSREELWWVEEDDEGGKATQTGEQKDGSGPSVQQDNPIVKEDDVD